MLRYLFHLLIVKPLVLILLGVNARGRHLLPQKGPAIIVANHNSHLDAIALMSLFSMVSLRDVHPVAAADYFCTNRWLNWFAVEIMGIIPIERKAGTAGQNTLIPLLQALDDGAILILFPEGTRGEPESLGKLKNGIGHILSERPGTPVTPVFFHGLGKSLPKGEFILVPFFVDAFVGAPLYWQGKRHEFMGELNQTLLALQAQAIRPTEEYQSQ